MKVPGVNYAPGEFLYETGKMMQFHLMSDGMFQWPTVQSERFHALGFGNPLPLSWEGMYRYFQLAQVQ